VIVEWKWRISGTPSFYQAHGMRCGLRKEESANPLGQILDINGHPPGFQQTNEKIKHLLFSSNLSMGP
jgi:hypothetical protein